MFRREFFLRLFGAAIAPIVPPRLVTRWRNRVMLTGHADGSIQLTRPVPDFVNYTSTYTSKTRAQVMADVRKAFKDHVFHPPL